MHNRARIKIQLIRDSTAIINSDYRLSLPADYCESRCGDLKYLGPS